MLETFGSPGLVLKTTLVLLAIGYAILTLRFFPRHGRAPLRQSSAAPALEFACGISVLLVCNHYLFFIWASQLTQALPGLLFGLPLVYSGGQGLVHAVRSGIRPWPPLLLLGALLVVLLTTDDQRLWPSSLYRLQAVIMGYPDLVLDRSEDLQGFVPPPGTRVIFQPEKYDMSCGLFPAPEAPRPLLPYAISCGEYFWGPAMTSIDPQLTDLPGLPHLAKLWIEEKSGRLTPSILNPDLSREALLDLQQLCPLTEQCVDSKGTLLRLVGQTDWPAMLAWLEGAGREIRISLRDLPSPEREELLQVLDRDVRERLSERVEALLVAYADAQASSLALQDLRPNYPFNTVDGELQRDQNSAGQWQKLKRLLTELMLKELPLGQHSILMPGVVLGLEQGVEGGRRLVYHTGVGRWPAEALLLFVLPLLLLCLVMSILGWHCIRTYSRSASIKELEQQG